MTKTFRALTVIAATATAMAAVGAVARPSAEWLRSELARILAGPEYHQPELTWLRNILRRVLEWLGHLLGGWSPAVSRLLESRPVLYWAVVTALVVLLALLLYHIGLTLVQTLRGPKRPKTPAVRAPVVLPEALRERAARLSREGRYGEAVRLLYEALLRQLDRGSLLRYDSSRTNREHLAALGERDDLTREMRPLTDLMDSILYGGRTPGAPEYGTCVELVERAWALVEASG